MEQLRRGFANRHKLSDLVVAHGFKLSARPSSRS